MECYKTEMKPEGQLPLHTQVLLSDLSSFVFFVKPGVLTGVTDGVLCAIPQGVAGDELQVATEPGQ